MPEMMSVVTDVTLRISTIGSRNHPVKEKLNTVRSAASAPYGVLERGLVKPPPTHLRFYSIRRWRGIGFLGVYLWDAICDTIDMDGLLVIAITLFLSIGWPVCTYAAAWLAGKKVSELDGSPLTCLMSLLAIVLPIAVLAMLVHIF